MKCSKGTLFSIMSVVMSAAPLVRAEDDGGEIELWPKDPGVFMFVDAQSRFSPDAVSSAVLAARSGLRYDFRQSKEKAPDLRRIPELLKQMGAKGAIWIVDDDSLPVCLGATESGWGVLNVAPILADTPDAATSQARLQKYLARLFANIHGVGDSKMMPSCVMRCAVDMPEIDKMRCTELSPEALGKIKTYMQRAGYKRKHVGTYYEACEEGWAPAPTNEIQKAIWEKVHQLPTKPMKIKPPRRKNTK